MECHWPYEGNSLTVRLIDLSYGLLGLKIIQKRWNVIYHRSAKEPFNRSTVRLVIWLWKVIYRGTAKEILFHEQNLILNVGARENERNGREQCEYRVFSDTSCGVSKADHLQCKIKRTSEQISQWGLKTAVCTFDTRCTTSIFNIHQGRQPTKRRR